MRLALGISTDEKIIIARAHPGHFWALFSSFFLVLSNPRRIGGIIRKFYAVVSLEIPKISFSN
jgi:hypothetical protein